MNFALLVNFYKYQVIWRKSIVTFIHSVVPYVVLVIIILLLFVKVLWFTVCMYVCVWECSFKKPDCFLYPYKQYDFVQSFFFLLCKNMHIIFKIWWPLRNASSTHLNHQIMMINSFPDSGSNTKTVDSNSMSHPLIHKRVRGRWLSKSKALSKGWAENNMPLHHV